MSTWQLPNEKYKVWPNAVRGILFLLIFIASASEAVGQLNGGTDNINYVINKTVQVAGKKSETDLANLSKESLAQTITFLDGLARPSQIIAAEANPSGDDIIQPILYDIRGRVALSFLPYSSSLNLKQYRTGSVASQMQFYNQAGDNIADDTAPYAQTIFENTPGARVIEQGAPGVVWQPGGSTPRTIRTKWRSNTSADGIKKFSFDFSTQKPTCVGNYAVAELSVSETLDEHQATTIIYTNSEGQIVVKKSHAYNTTVLGKTANAAGENAAAAAPPQSFPYYVVTYYIHDDFGNLRTVIQPEGVKELTPLTDWNTGITSVFLGKWCFNYFYDIQGRVTEKQVPGGGSTYLVYNSKDQLIATSTSRDQGGSIKYWQVIKYDMLGRAILTGYSNLSPDPTAPGLDRATLQAAVNSQATTALLYESRTSAGQGYTLTQAYPSLAAGDVQTLTFYDDYDYPNLANRPFIAENGVSSCFLRLTGEMTGHAERVLGTQQWLITKVFYDEKGQFIQSRADNYLNGMTRNTVALDFLGRPTATLLTHTVGTLTHTIRNTVSYDHAGRALQVTQQMDYGLTSQAPAIIVSSSAYDALGNLVDKKLHSNDNGANFLQSVDYRYNIRGWLTSINDRGLQAGSDGPDVETDLFGLELKYDNANQDGLLGGQPQYNGNISQVLWRTRNTATGNTLRGYSYQYDLLNRIKSADYATFEQQVGSSAEEWGKTKSDYSVSGITYTDNGNILTLNRRGRLSALSVTTNPTFGDLDKLRYKYTGNQLTAVDDAAAPTVLTHDFEDNGNKYLTSGNNEYTYDASGNLLRDDNKSITSIAYNQLNQPATIVFANGNTIQFVYAADGQKVRKITTPNGLLATTTDYVEGFVYQDSQLSFGPMPEGRVLRNANGSPNLWKYEYHIKDHLGNLRFAFRDNGGTAAQRGTTAGMEPANAPEEERTFRRVAETRTLDAARARTGRYVARLSAAQGTRTGPAITWPVQAGDSVYAEVYGRYDRAARAQASARRATVLLVPGVSLTPVPLRGSDAAKLGATRNATPQLSLGLALVPQLALRRAAPLAADRVPQAYLEIRVFTRDSQLVAVRHQALARTTTDDWQHLGAGLVADSAGYAEARLVNESEQPAYFDDMALRPIDAAKVQENHYDPFGLNLVGIEAQGSPNSKFQFNGQEKQEEFGLNWNDHGARFYDPQLGRWHVADPLADYYGQESLTPFNFGGNNGVNFADPSGLCPSCPGGEWSRDGDTHQWAGETFVYNASIGLWTVQTSEVVVKGEKAEEDSKPADDDGVDNMRGVQIGAIEGGVGVITPPIVSMVQVAQASVAQGSPLPAMSFLVPAIGMTETAKEAWEGNSETRWRIATQVAVTVAAALLTERVARTGVPCGCFVAATLVSTRQGSKPIEQIQVGDSVWAYNEHTRQVSLRPVTQVFRYERDTVYTLRTSSGQVLRATSDHPFYVRGRWVRVRHLRVGDSLISQTGQRHLLARIDIKPEHVAVYNFTVQGLHTYFVGQERILTHNVNCPPIKIAPQNKVNRGLLNQPKKPGNAPTFKSDGTPVEIHHEGQNPNGPFREMHRDDHRGAGNDLINHPNKGQPSVIDRRSFDRERRTYWRSEFP
jgi:RHS repeat-associated protein